MIGLRHFSIHFRENSLDPAEHIPPVLSQPPLGLSLNTFMEKSERSQYQAALAITGTNLSEELGWETLSDRRMCRRIMLQVHIIINRKTPIFLRDKLPPNRISFLSIGFRNIKCITNRYSNSFFPGAIASWNNIITHFVYFPTFDGLKDQLTALFRPDFKHIFGLHDPIGLRYLFQLRLSLSPLRSHKKCHNFIDTPSDICHCNQGIENTSHFLFSCFTSMNEQPS